MDISQNRRDTLKLMLETRRNDIQSLIDSSQVEQREREDRLGDSVDDDIQSALMMMRVGTLEMLIDALDRLEHDDYGNCHDCGEEIDESRLTLFPLVVRCKECNDKYDILERMKRARRS